LKVLVLGGTGQIGSAVSRSLQARGASVSILCRSSASAEQAMALGATPVDGDIAARTSWLRCVTSFDAVVHAAGTFDDAMGAVDSRLVSALLEALGRTALRRKLIYTAGIWLFGETPGPTGEGAAYRPPAAWSWTSDAVERVRASPQVEGMVVHPANVVDEDVGVPSILLTEAVDAGEVRVPVPLSATWPLVGRRDIGDLYARVLDRGRTGAEYIGASEPAIAVDRLARVVARRAGLPDRPVYWPLAHWMAKYGGWASGYGLSQNLRSDAARRELGWSPAFRFRDLEERSGKR
jgi:nucleoside-diphosphate-sugar epimerase